MTTEKNKETITRMVDELLNRQDFTHVSELIGPNFKRHDIGHLFPDRFGSEGTKDHVSRLRAGIPDLQAEILDLFAEGDRVCMRYVVRGTHTGELLGKQGTGNPVRWEGVNIYRMVDGKAVETWQFADALSLLRQIGALPSE
jgi:predicted ester cyclase